MKLTVVPAQVTTVEDKVAGNLSFTQLLLLTMPVFVDGAFFVLFPPLFKLTALKLIIGVILAVICLMLAIRIKGKLLLTWIVVIGRYNVRPRYYIFNKNDSYLRKVDNQANQLPDSQDKVIAGPTVSHKTPLIPTPEMVRLETAVADPRAKFHFKATKGRLRVYINEVKE